MEKLRTEDVESIFSAINVAEAEVGKEWEEVKERLYLIYPEVRLVHEEKERLRKEGAARQKSARKGMADACYAALDTAAPMLPQVVVWVGVHQKALSKNYSDEICIAADLWRYHPDMIPALSKEMRNYIEGGNETWRTWSGMERTDQDMWHELVEILEHRTEFNRSDKARM